MPSAAHRANRQLSKTKLSVVFPEVPPFPDLSTMTRTDKENEQIQKNEIVQGDAPDGAFAQHFGIGNTTDSTNQTDPYGKADDDKMR